MPEGRLSAGVLSVGDAPGATAGRRGRDFVLSLERGLAVIKAFDREHPRLTLAEVARHTGMTRAAARRFLLTLVELGYMDLDGRVFFLRPRVLELGHAYLSSLSLNDVAALHMERLVAQVSESSSIAVLDGDDITYVVRVPTRRIMTVSIAVGTRFPAHATSMGRVLLAGLAEADLDAYLERAALEPLTRRTVTDPAALRRALATVAAQGYSVVDQELEDGLRSIAVPVTDGTGVAIAALNVSTHASRATLDALRYDVLPVLRATARSISADVAALGGSARSAVFARRA
jgi:IclR family transcriptional regulator, pca regulon regulatory protein